MNGQTDAASRSDMPQALPIDLSREEYIRCQLLVSRAAGLLRMRWVQLVGLLTAAVSLLAMTGYVWWRTQTVDWLALVMAVLMGAAALALWLAVPRFVARRAGKVYDESVDGGYSYYGLLRVYTDRVEKVGDNATAIVPLDGTSLFLEAPDMMIWLGREHRAIVMPARCMTQEAAVAARHAADRQPGGNRRFYGRLVPAGQPVAAPAPVEDTVRWEHTVRYEEREYAIIAQDAVRRRFVSRLPVSALLCFFAALAFGWSEESILPCILLFLLTMLLLTFLWLWMPLSRIRSGRVQYVNREFILRLTDRGVRLFDRSNDTAVPWSAVGHVVNRGEMIEITARQRSVYIPCRYVADMNEFDALLKGLRSKK